MTQDATDLFVWRKSSKSHHPTWSIPTTGGKRREAEVQEFESPSQRPYGQFHSNSKMKRFKLLSRAIHQPNKWSIPTPIVEGVRRGRLWNLTPTSQHGQFQLFSHHHVHGAHRRCRKSHQPDLVNSNRMGNLPPYVPSGRVAIPHPHLVNSSGIIKSSRSYWLEEQKAQAHSLTWSIQTQHQPHGYTSSAGTLVANPPASAGQFQRQKGTPTRSSARSTCSQSHRPDPGKSNRRIPGGHGTGSKKGRHPTNPTGQFNRKLATGSMEAFCVRSRQYHRTYWQFQRPDAWSPAMSATCAFCTRIDEVEIRIANTTIPNWSMSNATTTQHRG